MAENNVTTPSTSATDFASPDETRDLAASFAASLGQTAHAGGNTHQNEDGISARDWALFRDPVLHNERLEAIRKKKGFIIDMDGVIYHVSLWHVRFITFHILNELRVFRDPTCCLVPRNLLIFWRRTTKSISSLLTTLPLLLVSCNKS